MQFLTEPILVKEKKVGSYVNKNGEHKEWYGFTHKVTLPNDDVLTQTEFISEKLYNKLEENAFFCFYGTCYTKDSKPVWFLTDCEKKK